MRGKRGADSEHIVIAIAAILLTVGPFFILFGQKIAHIGDSGALLKAFYARDIAYLVDATEGTVNDVSIHYPEDTSGYEVNISNTSVKVSAAGNGESFSVHNPFNFRIDDMIRNQPLILTRSGDSISVSSTNLKKLRCPLIAPKEGLSSIILDPGHGGPTDKGIIGQSTEAEQMRLIALAASEQLHGLASTRSLQNDAPENLALTQRITQIQGHRYAISIHGADHSYAKAYINADPLPSSNLATAIERQALACDIVNSLSDSIEGVAVIPVDLHALAQDDPRQVLRASEVGVYLELGSPLHEPRTGKAIADGIEVFLNAR